MRIPVYSASKDPHKDPWLCKKSLWYVAGLLRDNLAFPVDYNDIKQGVMLRGYVDVHHDSLNRVAGAGFSTAWSIRQSGNPGPLVWQLNTMKVANG